MTILLRGRHGIALAWSDLRPDIAYIKRAFFLGFPGSIELSTRGLGLVIMSFLVASFGTLPIAAYGVGSNIVQVVTILAMGLSMAVSTLVGQNIGAGNVQRAARTALLGNAIAFGVLSLAGILAYWFRAAARGIFRAGRCRGDCRGRPLHPHHVPRLGRHRHSALRGGDLPGVWATC